MKFTIRLVDNEKLVTKNCIVTHWEEDFEGSFEDAKKFGAELLKKYGGEIYIILNENHNSIYANKDVPYILED